MKLLPTSQAVWDGTKYTITLNDRIKQIRPFSKAGEIWLNGQLQFDIFRVSPDDRVEYFPVVDKGRRTWELQVQSNGLSVVAKVRFELAGQYALPEALPDVMELDLAKVAVWESRPVTGEFWDEEKLNADLAELNVVHGRREEAWAEIEAVQGLGDVLIAVATPAIPAVDAVLEDYVSKDQDQSKAADKKIDFFASKIQIVQEGAVLARKIPGKPGVPGRDVFGQESPVAEARDFQFRLKKNVHLSEDGLAVIASCGGQPVRADSLTYLVENVYILHQDADLATGSIEFPGDVMIRGNVQDGMRIFAGGRLEIKGSVSHANIKAEKGGVILQSLLGGKAIIGEKFVVRSELLNQVSELQAQLSACLNQTAELLKLPQAANFKPEQCLKLITEKQFADLPKLATRVEKFILEHKDEIITEEIVGHIRVAKHFLVGLGPLDPKSVPYLQGVEPVLARFVENISLEIPEKLNFAVNYVQGAVVECAGSLTCKKGVYNSDIRVKGDVEIEGVCRGGKLASEGQIHIHELGGSEVSSTFVQISQKGRLRVDYCHSNAIISVGKEVVNIEEDCRNLEVYRDSGGFVQVEKLRGATG